MATLVVPAYLYRINLLDGEIITSERFVNLAYRVAAWVTLTFEHVAKLAFRDCRGQLFAQSRHSFGLCHIIARLQLAPLLVAGHHVARRRRHYQAVVLHCPLRQQV